MLVMSFDTYGAKTNKLKFLSALDRFYFETPYINKRKVTVGLKLIKEGI
jgi:hypothetical protein